MPTYGGKKENFGVYFNTNEDDDLFTLGSCDNPLSISEEDD